MGLFDRKKNSAENNENPPERKPNYTLRMIGGGYLVYLAWDFYQGYRTETLQDVSPTTALIGAAFFAISGIIIFAMNLRGDIISRRKDREAQEAMIARPDLKKAVYNDEDGFYSSSSSESKAFVKPEKTAAAEEPAENTAEAAESAADDSAVASEDYDDFYGTGKKEESTDEQ